MPIKLPKGFQRRKSSGNVLDEVQNPPGQTSFRVFERPDAIAKSLDTRQNLRDLTESKPWPPSRHSFEEEDEGDLFSYHKTELPNRYGSRSISTSALANKVSGSGGTENSVSTIPYDRASVSTRLSNASTDPSSTSIRSIQKSPNLAEGPYNDIPVPPAPKHKSGFLRGAQRGFSFGNKSQYNVNTTSAPPTPPPAANYDERPSYDLPEAGRDRSITASSASTATPPKLFDSDLTLNSSELDGFSNMFDNIGRRSALPSPRNSPLVGSQPRMTSGVHTHVTQAVLSSPPPRHDSPRQQRSAVPAPLKIDQDRNIESSPYSWTSNDGLLRSPSPTKTVVPTQDKPPQMISRKALDPRALQDIRTPDLWRPNGLPNRKSPSPLGRSNHGHISSPERTNSSQNLLADQSPAPGYPSSPEARHSFDSTLAAEADLVSKWQERPASLVAPKSNNKIMTPAQFERYRQQHEREQKLAGPSGDKQNGDSDSDHYDEDDDAERDRQAVRQRRKQEAHLAIYRQTMMKVTGEQANPRVTSGKLPNSSSADLSARLSYLTVDSRNSGKSSNEEEEDDDVPLGILAAHGFPNKNRPPARLTSASSPSVMALTQPQATTAAPPSAEGRRGSLPVFARNLPQDPYFGAGVVNPSHRESMGMGGGSTLGVPITPNMQPYPVHPAGLVGVIASEEKSRQMRRGSPNAQGNYEMPLQHPGMPRSQTMGTMGYPETMGMAPMLTPGEMQMNQQMAQMMQMQQHFMQQMQQMMGGQLGQPQPVMPPAGQQSPGGMLMPPGQAQRPYSMPMPPSSGVTGQRSMGTVSPGMAKWNQRPNSYFPPANANGGPGYAASLAPSERSNVGLAPRYRPVSTIGQENLNWKRSSTFTSGTIRPVLPGKGVTQSAVAVDEDDDDEGWKEMKAKRDNKKSKWKMKKQTGTSDLFPNGSALH